MKSENEINHDTSSPNSFWISVSLILTTISLIAIILGTLYLYNVEKSNELDRKEKIQNNSMLNEIRKHEAQMLNSTKWINKKKGLIQIPIQKAMTIVKNDYSN